MHINLLLKSRSSPLYKNAVVPSTMSLCRKDDRAEHYQGSQDAAFPFNCWSFQPPLKSSIF